MTTSFDPDELDAKPKQRKVRPAKDAEAVFKSLCWWLEHKNYFVSIDEMKVLLLRKTDNREWIDIAIERAIHACMMRSNEDLADSFISQCFFAEYGTGYIVKQLDKRCLTKEFVLTRIAMFKLENNIVEQELANNYLNSTYALGFGSNTVESMVRRVEKRGFNNQQARNAFNQYALKADVPTKAAIKASKLNIESEIIKYAKRGKGIRAIQSELRSKQADMTTFDIIVDNLVQKGEIDFFENALNLLRKRIETKRLDPKDFADKAKLYQYMGSRGFDSSQISYAFVELTQTNE